MTACLLDTNLFITSEQHIPRDIFPSFWDRFGMTLQTGEAVLHKTVLDELEQRKDAIVPWLKSLNGVKPMQASSDTLEKYLEVCAWAENNGYTKEAIREFQSGSRADAWLVAEGAASGLAVVTYEKRSDTIKKVKIPNACEAFGVEWVSGFDFMRQHGFKF